MLSKKISNLPTTPSVSGDQYIIVNSDITEKTTLDSLSSLFVNHQYLRTLIDGSYIDVTTRGIDNTGATSITTALNSLLQEYPNGNTFYFPEGVYNFDSPATIIQPNVTIELHPKAILRVTNRPFFSGRVILYIKNKNTTIRGGTLSGDWLAENYNTGRLELNVPSEIDAGATNGLITLLDTNFTDDLAGGGDLTNITIEGVKFTKTPVIGIGGYFQSGDSFFNIPDEGAGYRLVRDIKINNNIFELCRVAAISLFNYKNTITPPTSALKYIKDIYITNNMFLSSGKTQENANLNVYNPQGMGIFASLPMAARSGVYVTSIQNTNKVAISGLKFDQSSIGYMYEIINIGAPNPLTGELYSTLTNYPIAVSAVSPTGVAECVVLSSSNGNRNWLLSWVPHPNTTLFTGTSSISGNDDYTKSFKIAPVQNFTGKGYYQYQDGRGNFIGILGPTKNVVVERNFFKDSGRMALEFFYSQAFAENTTVRNNHFINIPYYSYSIGGIGINIQNNTHDNCHPIIETYGKNINIESNIFNSGVQLTNMSYGSFRNNTVNARPGDSILVGCVDQGATNWIIENNQFKFANGINYQHLDGASPAFLKLLKSENYIVRNNTWTITGPVSSFYTLSLPMLLNVGGNSLVMENNKFLLSGWGLSQKPYQLFNLTSLYNSTIKNNHVITTNKIEYDLGGSGYPLWGNNHLLPWAHGLSATIYVAASGGWTQYPIKGSPGYTGAVFTSPVSSYPQFYNIDDTYIINPVTDFTVDATHKYYLSAWNDHRNQVAKYKGSGLWDYYTITDIMFDGTKSPTYYFDDALIGKNYTIAPTTGECYLITSNYLGSIFSNVSFEGNNFTYYDSICSFGGSIAQTGLSWRYPILFNTRVINNKDALNITLPRLALNSDVETNGTGNVYANTKGERYKTIVTDSGTVSAVKL